EEHLSPLVETPVSGSNGEGGLPPDSFVIEVDVDKGTITSAHGSTNALTLIPEGTSEAVRVDFIGFDRDAACPGGVVPSFCVTAQVRSFYSATALENVYIELNRLDPITGYEPLNTDTVSDPDLDPSIGVWAYEDLGPAGECSDRASRVWSFNRNGTGSIQIAGRVKADLRTLSGQTDWWNTDWGRRRSIRIDNTGQNETLNGFPLPVRFDACSINYALTAPGGADLRFFDDEGVTPLPHEVERWVPGGESLVWVRVPSITAASEDLITVYYDNPAAAAEEDPAGVWADDFVAVYHLTEEVADSSPGNNSPAPTPDTSSDGLVGGAQSFDGISYFDLGGLDVAASGEGNDGMTLSAWMNPDGFIAPRRDNRIITKSTGSSPNQHWWMMSTRVNAGDTRLRFRLKTGTTTTELLASSGDVPLNGWTYGVATYDGAAMRLFQDAVLVGQAAKSGAIATDPSVLAAIGGNPPDAYQPWQGRLDEVRIASVSRSTDWIDAEYQNLLGNFVVRGTVEAFAGQSDWLDGTSSRRLALTFNNAARTDTLTDFPVLVTFDGSVVDYGDIQPDADDLRWYDSDGTLLSHEVERWEPSGTSSVWVRVPRIEGASDSDGIAVYYGDASATSVEDVAGVWSNGFVAVWHMNSGALDSSGMGVNGTSTLALNAPQSTAGVLAGAQLFDGSEYAELGSFDVAPTGTVTHDGITLSGWVRADGFTGVSDNRILSKASGTSNANHWWMLGTREQGAEVRARFRLKTAGTTTELIGGSSTVLLDEWTFLSATYNGSLMQAYQDGVFAGSTGKSGAVNLSDTVPVWLGANPPDAYRGWIGAIDEVRIASVARSEAWLRAEYLAGTGQIVSVGVPEQQ
ncbi:MAG: DUF2341 domain-containing protein, partial [Myxococcota bacterium]